MNTVSHILLSACIVCLLLWDELRSSVIFGGYSLRKITEIFPLICLICLMLYVYFNNVTDLFILKVFCVNLSRSFLYITYSIYFYYKVLQKYQVKYVWKIMIDYCLLYMHVCMVYAFVHVVLEKSWKIWSFTGAWGEPIGLNTLRPRQNGRHFPDDIFKCIFVNKNTWIFIKISLKFVP